MTSNSTGTSGGPVSTAIPLYDMFLDLPHPCASPHCPKPFVIESPLPASAIIATELHKNILQIVRFAFPDYDESIEIKDENNSNNSNIDGSLNKYDVYAMQSKSFMSFTFSLQLSSGVRVHGHVRRYLPPHLGARTRYDVGRRGERALCILTRATGADSLYSAILKTVEAISSQQAALSSRPQLMPHKGEPQKYFLFQMTRYQQHVSSLYGTGPQYERGKPLIAALSCIEIGDEYRSLYKDTDITRFIIPTTLLQSSTNIHPNGQQHQPSTSMLTYNGSILPLLRCVGVYHSIRIMTALLCERRVIFVSSSPTRLAACSNAALSMLTCGLLQWQHLYIPVLPPHLWQYLAAPYPYLIGVLSSAMHKLDKTDGLGEVLMIQLDTNQLEARGMEPSTILQRLPDLCNTNNSQDSQLMVPGGTNVTHFSASDQLAQDLFDVLRNDKKILYGLTGANFAANVVGETATKATIAVKNTFLKLRDKSRQLLQQKSTMTDSGNLNGSGAIDSVDESHFSGSGADGPPGPENSMASDYIYTEGCHNDICEEDCRIALTVFFLCLVGDLKWYLTASAPNSLPVLDRNKFLQQKRAMGDREGTAIFQLLQNFVQTQMLEEFAKARIEDSIKTQPVPSQDTPLFLQCTTYHRQHHIDFVVHDVKRIIQRIVESNPTSASRVTGQLKSNARRNAMTLTSNKGPESGAGDVSRVMAQLVEECRESTSILSDVMSVIWLRLRDSKGMQWKHGLQALQLLRSLLLHGPLAAISEAVDGLDKIRALKYYENMRPVSVLQVRSIASSVYRFLIDRALLFQARRSCIDRRRQLLTPSTIKLIRETRALCTSPFRAIHTAFHPSSGRGTIVQIPTKAVVAQTMVRDDPTRNNISPKSNVSQQQQQAQSGVVVDFFTPSPVQPVPQPDRQQQTASSVSNDLLGLFDTMAVANPSTTVTTTANTNKASNPFDAFTAQPINNTSASSVPSPLVAIPPSLTTGNTIVPIVASSYQHQQQQPYQDKQQKLQQPSPYATSNQPIQQQAAANPFTQQQPTFAVIPRQQRQMVPPQQQQNVFPPPTGQMISHHIPQISTVAARGIPGQPQPQHMAQAQVQQQFQYPGAMMMPHHQPQAQSYPHAFAGAPQQQQQHHPNRPTNTSQFDPLARK